MSSVICEACRKPILDGEEVAQVLEGECTGVRKRPFRGKTVRAFLHRTCFLRRLGSPKATRILLEEGQL